MPEAVCGQVDAAESREGARDGTDAGLPHLPGHLIQQAQPQGTRRRIKTEEKAKVVAAVWGTEFIQVFCHASTI